MEDNFHLTSKKGLFLNMKDYYALKGQDIFMTNIFPLTYLIKEGKKDVEFEKLI
jgi:hypothetical protein